MPVMCTRNVLTPAPADNAWVEYSFGRKPPLRKEALGPIAQLIPKPILNGHREALLRPVDQVLRNIPVEYLSKEALAGTVPRFHAWW